MENSRTLKAGERIAHCGSKNKYPVNFKPNMLSTRSAPVSNSEQWKQNDDLKGTSSGHGLICVQRRARFLPKEFADSLLHSRHSRCSSHYFDSINVIFFQICKVRKNIFAYMVIISHPCTVGIKKSLTYELVQWGCAVEVQPLLRCQRTSLQTDPCHTNKTRQEIHLDVIRWHIISGKNVRLSFYLLSLLDTSMSFMKHSMLSGRSEEFALISFFSFSHSW